MLPEELFQKIHGELKKRFRIAGQGSVSQVEEALQLGSGYFRDQRRPDRLRVDLRTLVQSLNFLKVDLSEFFNNILGSLDPVEKFKAQAAALRRPGKKHHLKILELVLRRSNNETAATELSTSQIEELEILRRENPVACLKRIQPLVSVIPQQQLPRILGIYSSACRTTERIEDAHIVLAEALTIAQHQEHFQAQGDLLTRAGYIVAHQGDFDEALKLSEAATLSYARAGDPVGIGKTLVDQGLWRAHQENFPAALQMLNTALSYLPEETTDRPDIARNRFACLISIARIHIKTGSPEEAQKSAALALQHQKEMNVDDVADVQVLRASIALSLEQYDEARNCFEQAFEIFSSMHPLNAALVALELVKIDLLQGRHTDAYLRAKSMVVLVHPLQSNKLASAALTEFLRLALTGQGLTVGFVSQVTEQLKKERVRKNGAP